MSLEEYRRKRDFGRTSEPEASSSARSSDELRFVVQKHRARRLHYDFRLELDGVLKSWAVPKGPSLDSEDKRLAVMTEDHPLDYQTFEGEIPKGEYGAGQVEIWDRGTYHASGRSGRADSEPDLRKGLQKGEIKFYLEGEKLTGEFRLVRLKGGGEPNWLLFKVKDDPSDPGDGSLPQAPAPPEATGRARIKKTARGKATIPYDLDSLVKIGARQSELPNALTPMLATLTDEPFDRPGWFYEIKWDGFRALAETGPRGARLYSRTQQSFAAEFAPILHALEKIQFRAVLDGEIVVVDDHGRSYFRLLQQYRKTNQGLLVYYVFDLLYLGDYDLRQVPLAERKEALKAILPDLPQIKYSDHIETNGIRLYQLALENDLEGVIAKDKQSQYRTGVRSMEWLKFKTHQRQEAVIGGFTQPRGARTALGALLLGVYEGDDLVYVGHTGGGFSQEDLVEVRARLEPLVTDKSPFKVKPKTNTPATWVDPRLVCEVRFSDWTSDGRMRQPVYLGLREDKEARHVYRDRPLPAAQALKRKKLIRKEEQKEVVKIEGHTLTLTNPKKVFWPEEGITKADLIAYYREMAALILPYLRDRPQSLHRFPNGITGKSFYQKDVGDAPDWIQTIRIESDSDRPAKDADAVDYLLCQDEASLVYIVNLGCIDINPWNSRVGSLDQPDYLVVDLDPLEIPFEEVVRAAQVVHAILEEVQVQNFVKTSGQTGLHIYVPTGAKYDYEQVREFAHLIGMMTHEILPETTSLERSPSKRSGKVYLDFLQNRKGQTMAAPYALRPQPGAPVSTPLRWEEVGTDLDPRQYNFKSIKARIEQVGDLWEPTLGAGIDLAKSLKRLEQGWEKIQAAIKA